MRYRDSDALFLPARVPEHAAPVRFLSRRRSPRQPGVAYRIHRLTRQVLHFCVMAIAWATGIGLVIGSIVLIATVTAPGHAGPPGSALRPRDQNSVPQLTPHVAVSAAPGYRVLAAFSGRGDRTTGYFSVKAKLRWQLRWTYRRCAPQADEAQFTLLQADMGPGQPTISTTTEDFTRSGGGSAWLRATGHQYYLEVISACSWHVKVVLAA
jgi:hypothetical protein